MHGMIQWYDEINVQIIPLESSIPVIMFYFCNNDIPISVVRLKGFVHSVYDHRKYDSMQSPFILN